MQRRALLKLIRDAASARHKELGEIREGANHTIYAVGGFRFAVPRHSELNEYTAEEIMKDLEDELGKGWWRR